MADPTIDHRQMYRILALRSDGTRSVIAVNVPPSSTDVIRKFLSDEETDTQIVIEGGPDVVTEQESDDPELTC